MGADASHYSALGLDPDADDVAIDRAYKRLIKKHHPDRKGGDARRAAEINRAYRELRGPKAKDALELNEDVTESREHRPWMLVVTAAAGGLLIGLLLATPPISEPIQQLWDSSAPHLPITRGAAAAAASDAMNQPLNIAAIDGATRDAVRMSRSQDEMALATASRDCHHQLRTEPSIAQLDRCAAFDDAVVELQDRDPLRDQGPFGQLAVTGRQWSGASALSNDYLAIDARLDRIRLHVELALAPALEPAVPA